MNICKEKHNLSFQPGDSWSVYRPGKPFRRNSVELPVHMIKPAQPGGDLEESKKPPKSQFYRPIDAKRYYKTDYRKRLLSSYDLPMSSFSSSIGDYKQLAALQKTGLQIQFSRHLTPKTEDSCEDSFNDTN